MQVGHYFFPTSSRKWCIRVQYRGEIVWGDTILSLPVAGEKESGGTLFFPYLFSRGKIVGGRGGHYFSPISSRK